MPIFCEVVQSCESRDSVSKILFADDPAPKAIDSGLCPTMAVRNLERTGVPATWAMKFGSQERRQDMPKEPAKPIQPIHRILD